MMFPGPGTFRAWTTYSSSWNELPVNNVQQTRSGHDGGRRTVEISMDMVGVIVYVTD